MTVVSVAGSVLQRLLVVAALIVGLVAMHHLVATGCAAVMGGHDHATTASAAPGSALSHDSASGEFVSLESQLEMAAGHESHPATAVSLGGAASLCLAIVVFLLILRRPTTVIAAWFGEHRVLKRPLSPARQRVEQPPDLTVLSISRT